MQYSDLYIDVETFSSVDIMTSGAYAYTESPDFEILILCYKLNNQPIKTVDLASGEDYPAEFLEALQDPKCLKHAHNAAFERLCFRRVGYEIPVEQWHCSAVKAAYCGLPLSLDNVSKAMQLGEASKDAAGKALIKYFSCPVKPTQINGGRTRNMPEHNPEKWEKYKRYCEQDVYAEFTILERLKDYQIPAFEHQLYCLDQLINDRGVKVDKAVAVGAIATDKRNAAELYKEMEELTGLDNPNSPAQLKKWLGDQIGKEVKTIAKDALTMLTKNAGRGSAASKIIELRAKAAKTSIKKYKAMINCLCKDGRAHGLFQFYGANRTGRWAGRLIQLQNLPQNKMGTDKKGFDDLDFARTLVKEGNYSALYLSYDDLGSVLSQLIRTAFIPEEGNTFAVADFSAIEARVIAWLASEQWRLDVFNSHGMIYEASASKMFSVPLESIVFKNAKGEKIKGENYDMRAKGKVAELALGYQGGVGAMVNMGGDKMGLTKKEMKAIVKAWREANPNIKQLWDDIEESAILAVRKKREVSSGYRGITFSYDGYVMMIKLPSGRCLFYQEPQILRETIYEFERLDVESGEWDKGWAPRSRITVKDRFTHDPPNSREVDKLVYKGMNQTTKTWERVDTYGGKLVENIIQAIARDLLAVSMIKLHEAGFDLVAHIHDEVVAEVHKDSKALALETMCEIMSEPVDWASGLPLAADGFTTDYYKKDND